MTDSELLDVIADHELIEGLVGLEEDIHEYAFQVALENDQNADGASPADYRQALRQMLEDFAKPTSLKNPNNNS